MNLRSMLLPLSLAATTTVAAAQGDPDPRFITMDPITVGSPNGAAIGGNPAGFDVVVRDVNNAPRPGVTVSLHLGDGGLRLYSTQAPGTTIDCAQGTLSRVTDAQGQVNFVPRFGKWNDGNAVKVFVGDVEIGSVKARSPDYDGDGRVGLPDFAIFGEDYMTNPTAQRSDFDLNESTSIGDFSVFQAQFGALQAQPVCL